MPIRTKTPGTRPVRLALPRSLNVAASSRQKPELLRVDAGSPRNPSGLLCSTPMRPSDVSLSTRRISTGNGDNPLRDLFLTGIGTVDVSVLKKSLTSLAERSRDFKAALASAVELGEVQRAEVAAAVTDNAPAEQKKAESATIKECKLANLRTFAKERGLESLSAEEATMILMAFKDLGNFEEVIMVYERCQNREFRRSTVIREFYAVALNKTKQTDRSIAVSEQLNEEGHANGETYGALGKAYKIKEELEKAYEHYLRGYLMDFEYYCGVNAVYLLIALGREAEAEKLAEMVHYSTLQAGGIQSDDYWCVATMLEVACIKKAYKTAAGRAEMAQTLDKVLAVAKNDWEISSTLDNLRKLREQRQAAGENVRPLTIVVNALVKKMAEIHAPGAATTAAAQSALDLLDERSDLTRAILDKSFFYRGLNSNFIAGNYRLGGRLHDHVVNRADVEIVRRLLSILGLDRTTNLATFEQRINRLIRAQFGTDSGLEVLSGKQHYRFDAFMLALKEISASDVSGDSRTNIVADFLLGQGDCRQHAYFKQLVFDIWKNTNLTRIMTQAYKALMEQNDMTKYRRLMARVKKLERQQMFIFDVVVYPQIRMKGMYDPVRDEAGNLIVAESRAPYEEHALNVMAEFDKDGNVAKLIFADAFYQNVYRWQGHDAAPVLLADGTLELDGGKILVSNDAGQMVEATVKLRPADFAGKRDRPSTDEYGQLRMRGLLVSNPVDIAVLFNGAPEATHPVRAELDKFVASVTDHGVESGNVKRKG